MCREEHNKVDRLLSGAERSVQEREALFKRILAATSPGRRKRPGWAGVLVPVALGVAAVGVALLVLLPPEDNTADLTPRGAVAAGSIKLVCSGGGADSHRPRAGGRCRVGDTLAVAARPPHGAPFLSLAALSPDGVLVCYFPSEARGSLDLASERDIGVVIGGEHAPGTYRVFGVFSKQALSLARVRAMVEEAVAGRSPEVVQLKLEIGR